MVLSEQSAISAKNDMFAPLFGGQNHVLNGLEPAVRGQSLPLQLLNPVDRIRISLSVAANPLAGDPDIINPVYDTGASVSVLSSHCFARLRQNARIVPLTGWNCTVSAANGQPIKLLGAFSIKLHFQGKAFFFAFLVSPDLTTSLFGLNLATHYKFSFDADDKVVFIKKDNIIQQPSLDGEPFAEATVAKLASIGAYTGQKVTCRLQDTHGEPLLGCREGIIDLGLVAIRFDTDNHGRFVIHYPNNSPDTITISRGSTVGKVYSLEDWTGLSDYVPAAVGGIGPTQAGPARNRPQGRMRPHTAQEKAKIIETITSNINKSIPYLFRQKYIELLSSNEHVFSADEFDHGWSDLITHEMHFDNKGTCFTPQFRLSAEHLEFLRNSVVGWLKAGIIQRSRSLHNSPIFCVSKKQPGLLRPVLDYRRINSRCADDRYSIRTPDQCFEVLGKSGAKIFSSLDLRNSYWQMALRESDQPLTAFTLPGSGQFSWVSCPQGLMGAPASFSRLMERIMEGAKEVLTFIDDALIFSKDHDSHLSSLRDALQRLSKANLRLNAAKCIWGADHVEYLGAEISAHGQKPGLDKVAAVRNTEPPTTLRGLKSACGLFNYFRSYIYMYSRKAAPLNHLTRQSSGFKKGPLPKDALFAFENLKKEITSRPILAFPHPSRPFHLYVDAAQGDEKNAGGLGAALLQEQEDGSKRPVMFASRLLSPAESKYPVTLSEWLGCVFGMDKFEHWLRGKRFHLYTDHKPLARPFENLSKVHIRTLHRLNAKAEDFHPVMHYVEGKSNAIADFLSRYSGYNINWHSKEPLEKLRINANVALISHKDCSLSAIDASPNRIRLLQSMDDTLKEAIEAAAEATDGQPVKLPDFSAPLILEDGILKAKIKLLPNHLNNRGDNRIVLPVAMRQEVLAEAHNSLVGGHTGVVKVAERIKNTFWWPGMNKNIDEHVANCEICRRASDKYLTPTPPLTPIALPPTIGYRYHSDLYGPLKDKHGKQAYVCTVTDALSKFVRVYKIPDKTTVSVAKALYRDFSIFGIPRILVTDGGLEYRSQLQRDLMAWMGVSHKFTSIYAPWVNSSAEVFNRTMRHFLATAVLDAEKNETDWEDYLDSLVMSYNSSVSHATHVAPFTATFGTNMRVPLWPLLHKDMLLDEDLKRPGSFVTYMSRLRQAQLIARQLAHSMGTKSREDNARKYNDRNNVQYTNFSTGERVLCRRHDRRMANQKLAPYFEKGIILKQVADSTYLVRRYERKRGRDVNIHGRHLKKVSRLSDEEIAPDSSAADQPMPLPPSPQSHSSPPASRSAIRSRSPLTRVRSLSPNQIIEAPDSPSAPANQQQQQQIDSQGRGGRTEEGLGSHYSPPAGENAETGSSRDAVGQERGGSGKVNQHIPAPPLAQRFPIIEVHRTADGRPSISLAGRQEQPNRIDSDRRQSEISEKETDGILQQTTRKHKLPPSSSSRSHATDSQRPSRKKLLLGEPRDERQDQVAESKVKLPPPPSPVSLYAELPLPPGEAMHPVEDEFCPDAEGDDSLAPHEEGIRQPLGGQKHKFSHTSSDPILQKLPRLTQFGSQLEDELCSDHSLDSDGFPHALSSSDETMADQGERGRERRRRRRKGRKEGRASSIDSVGSDSGEAARKCPKLREQFVNAIFGRISDRRKNKYSTYSLMQLWEAFLRGELVAEPVMQTNRNTGASRPPFEAISQQANNDSARPPDPEVGADGGREMFGADRRCFRKLYSDVVRAPCKRNGQWISPARPPVLTWPADLSRQAANT